MELNTIIHGDCLEEMPKIPDKSIDHVFTSPPYNRERNDKYEHYDDRIANYYEFLCNAINQSIRISKGYVFFNLMKNYYNKADVFAIIGKYSKSIVDIIIWEKTNPLPASGKSITNAYEYFIVLSDKSLKSNTTYTKNIISTSVNSNMPDNHKAVMKQDVSDWFIEKFTKENEVILDCFAGTGTTAESCIKFNRNYILIEKEQKYVEVIKDRIQKVKNSQAERLL